MSEKGGWIPDKYISKAPLGDIWKSPEKVAVIKVMAGAMDKVINMSMIDDPVRRKRDEAGSELVKSLADEGEWVIDNVKELEAASKDGNRPQYQEVSENRLEILTGGLFYAIKEGKNEELKVALDSGNGVEIDNILPSPLRGLGKRVRNIEITNIDIRKTLDQLDIDGRDLKKIGKMGEGKLVENLQEASLKLVNLAKDLPEKDVEQYDKVFAYLTYEYNSLIKSENIASSDSELKGVLERLADALSSQGEEVESGVAHLKNKETQLSYVRGLFSMIESSLKTTRDIYLGKYSNMLEQFIAHEEVDDGVKKEVRSRLSLHDCSVLMKKANGYIERSETGSDPECPTISSAATLAEGMNHALNNESVSFFLRDGANGLPVDYAWDLYQDANTSYKKMLRKAEIFHGLASGEMSDDLKSLVDNDPNLGNVDANYYTDKNPKRKKLFDDFIIKTIVQKKNVSSSEALKSWDLAKKLAGATGENSVFNVSLAGNDELGEDIFLRLYRQGRDEKGRPRGPQIHLKEVEGVGNSWLREKSGITDRTKPMHVKDIKFDEIQEGDYVYHFGVLISAKIHPLRNLLLDRAPDPSKLINIDFFQKAVDYFNKADKDDKNKLREWWIAGVVDLACSYGNLGWTQSDLSKFRQFATMNLSDKAGPFIKKEKYDELIKKFGFHNKMLKLDLKRVARGFFDTMSGSNVKR